MIKPGMPAPDFRLPAAGGGEVRLGDLAGKWTVIFFYSRDNTTGCTAEAVEFTELNPEFESLGAVVVGISGDSVSSHDSFRQKHNLSVMLLSDPDRSMMDAYNAWGEKTVRGKKTFGAIRSTVLIDPKGIVRAHWPKVQARGHAPEVLKALKEAVAAGS